MPSTSRRALLGALAAGSLAGLAGCSSSCPDSGAPEPDALVQFGQTRPFDGPPATDWPAPQFDAGRTGYAPAATPPEPPVGVRWRASVPGPDGGGTSDSESEAEAGAPPPTRVAPSAPIVAGGSVVVATRDGVVALAFTDGAERWRADVSPAVRSSALDYDDVAVTPVADDDGTVYAAAADALVALAADDGSERWRRPLSGQPRGPVLADGAVYTAVGNEVVAVDAADGRERWRATVPGAGPPTVGAGAVVTVGDSVVALEADSGEERWRTDVRAEFAPVVAGGVAYVGGYEGLRALDGGDGAVRWTFERGGGRTLTPPVVADGTLYVTERPGEAGDATFALDAGGGPPEPRWCSDVGDGTITAAAGDQAFGVLSGGFAPDDGDPLQLVAFDERLGAARWAQTGRQQVRPPAVVDGAVITVDRTGAVTALGEV